MPCVSMVARHRRGPHARTMYLEHQKTAVTLQTVSDKTTRHTCNRMIITNIRQFLVKRLEVELRVFGVVEAGDDISRALLGNQLLEAQLSHASLQDSSVRLVPEHR